MMQTRIGLLATSQFTLAFVSGPCDFMRDTIKKYAQVSMPKF